MAYNRITWSLLMILSLSHFTLNDPIISLFLNFKLENTLPTLHFFVDVEGTKSVKQMITLLVITGQFIPHNRCGSKWQ